MSVKAQNWVWQHSRAEGNNLLVALAIADRANDEGEDCWPSMETLCRKTRLSRSTVSRCVGSLEALGEVRVDRELGKKNSYVLTMPDYGDGENQYQPGAVRPVNVARPTSVNLTQVDNSDRCQSDTALNSGRVSELTPPPVSAVRPPPVSLLTHKTSCTSSTSGTKDYSAGKTGASRAPVEKPVRAGLWNRCLAIAHRVIEDYPNNSENWSHELKSRMLNQGIDANDQGPGRDKPKLFARVLEACIEQRKTRRGDGGVFEWRHRRANRGVS